jgi:predicted  nucleic acid-binding Zn-ribbon protein
LITNLISQQMELMQSEISALREKLIQTQEELEDVRSENSDIKARHLLALEKLDKLREILRL